jgi:hypothetical protein
MGLLTGPTGLQFSHGHGVTVCAGVGWHDGYLPHLTRRKNKNIIIILNLKIKGMRQGP